MTTTPNIAELVAKLQRHLAALDDGRDAKSDNEKAAWWSSCTETQRCISGLMNPDLDKPQRLLAECEERRAIRLKKQAEIEQAIADAPDWRSLRDGRERDKEYDRQLDLKKSLQLLHDGKLLYAPGVAYERVGDLDARIAELQQRIAVLRGRLDAHLKAAEALLGETVMS